MTSLQDRLWHRLERARTLANRSLYAGAFVATTLFGGSLFAMMLYASASRAPQWALLFMRPPFNGGFTFFVMFNSLMEWLFLGWCPCNGYKPIFAAGYGSKQRRLCVQKGNVPDIGTLPHRGDAARH